MVVYFLCGGEIFMHKQDAITYIYIYIYIHSIWLNCGNIAEKLSEIGHTQHEVQIFISSHQEYQIKAVIVIMLLMLYLRSECYIQHYYILHAVVCHRYWLWCNHQNQSSSCYLVPFSWWEWCGISPEWIVSVADRGGYGVLSHQLDDLRK